MRTLTVKSWLCALFDREDARLHSTMLAYESVGKEIGRSTSWVRQHARGYADAKIAPNVQANIERVYYGVRDAIAADNDRLLDELQKLEEINGRLLRVLEKSKAEAGGNAVAVVHPPAASRD